MSNLGNIYLFAHAQKLAIDAEQTIGEKNDLYITLRQLMALMMNETPPPQENADE